MITDNLAGLFAPAPRGAAMPASFRVGQLLAFNADDGSNTVAIGTSLLPNLPMLQTGAEIGLEPGDNVLVMYLGNSAMIIGKIATVGGPNYGASNAGRTGLVLNASNWATATTGAVVISDTSIQTPGWARSVELTMLGAASTHNSEAAGNFDNIFSQVRVQCPGQPDHFSAGVACAVGGTLVGSTYALYSNVVDVTPNSLLTFTYTITTLTVAWAARTDNLATLFVRAAFYREGT